MDKDRRYAIDAAIVRIMKSRKARAPAIFFLVGRSNMPPPHPRIMKSRKARARGFFFCLALALVSHTLCAPRHRASLGLPHLTWLGAAMLNLTPACAPYPL